MTNRFGSMAGKLAVFGGGGLLLQANGCTVDAVALVQGLTETITTNLVTSFVFNLFGLPSPV